MPKQPTTPNRGMTLAERRAAATAARTAPAAPAKPAAKPVVKTPPTRVVKPKDVIAPPPVEEDEDDDEFPEFDAATPVAPDDDDEPEEDEDEDDDDLDDDDEDEDDDDEDEDDEEDDSEEDEESDGESDDDDEDDDDEDADDDDEEESDDDDSEDEEDDEDEDEDDEDEEPAPPPVRKGPHSVASAKPAALGAQAAKAAPSKGKGAKTAPEPVSARSGASGGALAKRSTPLPLATHGIPDRSRMLSASDQIMPKLKMGQGLSGAVRNRQVELGNWYLTGRNLDLGKTTYIIPVDMRQSRSIWKNGVGVICRSFDMVQGVGDPGILCEGTLEEMNSLPEDERGCSYRLWSEDEAGNRKKPVCERAFNYPVIVVIPDEDGDMDSPKTKMFQAVLSLRNTSTPAAKAINSAMQAAEPRWLDNIFELSITEVTRNGMTYNVAQAAWFGETTDYPRLRKRAEAYERIAGPANNAFLQENLETDDRDTE